MSFVWMGGGSMTVHLYHWEPNANSGKPMLALAEKGVEFESHYIDLLKFDQHQPDYLKINPDGTIPAMVHGDRVLTESTPMMEYVDDAFDGPPLKPTNPKERWRMRWWMRFFDALLRALAQHDRVERVRRPGRAATAQGRTRGAIARIPLESRRIAWRKAMFNEFSEAELTESRRRVHYCTAFSKSTWRVTSGLPARPTHSVT
jgi:glutathione S-transferase/GST-like protein